MFDVGFTELVLIFVIGLIVLGPERLPKVARGVGRWLGRARQMARSMQFELERELDLKEMGLGSDKSPSNVTSHPEYGAPPGHGAQGEPGAEVAEDAESSDAGSCDEAAAPTDEPVAEKSPRADGANG